MKSSEKYSQKSSDDLEKPVFNPRDLVGALTLKPPEELLLKKRAIITFDKKSLEFLKEKSGATLNPNWYPYRKIYEIHGRETIFVRSFPSGPCLAQLTEEVVQFGTKEILIFGFCGSLVEWISIGDIVIAKGAICDEGTSRHYGVKEEVVSSTWFENLKPLIEREGISSCLVWTTDGLYRETKGKIEQFRSKGAHVVDMEVASFYAVCNFLGVDGIAFLVVSDILKNSGWIPGFYLKEFLQGKERALRLILENFVL